MGLRHSMKMRLPIVTNLFIFAPKSGFGHMWIFRHCIFMLFDPSFLPNSKFLAAKVKTELGPERLFFSVWHCTSTKLWMHANVAGVYNTLSITKDMGMNTMSGILAQKWPTPMPSTSGKIKMGQRSETHTIFSSGEECKSGSTDLQHYTQVHSPSWHQTITGQHHHTCSWHQTTHPHVWLTLSHMQPTTIHTAAATTHLANTRQHTCTFSWHYLTCSWCQYKYLHFQWWW